MNIKAKPNINIKKIKKNIIKENLFSFAIQITYILIKKIKKSKTVAKSAILGILRRL